MGKTTGLFGRLTGFLGSLRSILVPGAISSSVQKKMAASFIGVAALTLVLGGISLMATRRSHGEVEKMVNVYGRMARLAEDSMVSLLQARRHEKNYFTRHRELGFEEARKEYVGRVQSSVGRIAENMGELKRVPLQVREGPEGKPFDAAKCDDVIQAVKQYEGKFLEMVNHLEARGLKDSGVLGKLRATGQEMENVARETKIEQLLSLIYRIDSDEKAYLLYGEEEYLARLHAKYYQGKTSAQTVSPGGKYAVNLRKAIAQFKAGVSGSRLAGTERTRLLSLVDEYRAAFDRLVQVNEQIAAADIEFTGTARGLEAPIESIYGAAKKMQDASQAEVKRIAQGTMRAVAVISLIVFVIGISVARLLSGGIIRQVKVIMDVFGEIGVGNFSARANVVSRDELGSMASSLNAMLDNTLALIQTRKERDAMQAAVTKLLDEISGLAEGDLTRRAEVTAELTGSIADAFNAMAEQLSKVVQNVTDASAGVSSVAHDVRTTTDELAKTNETQATQITEAIAAINEMAASIQQVSENAGRSAEVSEQSTVNAKEGAKAVEETNRAMEAIRERVQQTARAIKRLGESSQEIGNIVQIINDIADRTSILALNASIQAAMAGDAGRGFAVVAEEVQRLAERSTDATKQIETLIKNIQGEIGEAGTSMDDSIQRVVAGSELANQAYGKLQAIENVSTRLAELVQSILMAAKQQARASEDITKTMEELGAVTSQTSAASKQTALSMENLAETADKLSVSVASFKIGGDGNGGRARQGHN